MPVRPQPPQGSQADWLPSQLVVSQTGLAGAHCGARQPQCEHPMAITGVTAIRPLSSFFQVVFIDCPFRLGLRSTDDRRVCGESLAPRGEITGQLGFRARTHEAKLPSGRPGPAGNPLWHLSRGLRDRLTVGVALRDWLGTVARSHPLSRRIHRGVRLALHLHLATLH